MRLQALSLMMGLSFASAVAFAEPAIQPGETLESLSKVKITTTVNGQLGSINDLVASGQVKLISDSASSTQPITNSTIASQVDTAQPEQSSQIQVEDQSIQAPALDSAQVMDQTPQPQNVAPADVGSSNLEAPINGATLSEPSANEQPNAQPEALPQAK